MLIAFGGLPGTGKTILAQALATEFAATYVRIDTIEQTLRGSTVLAGDVGPAGYLVGYAVAEDNLRLGRMVVADSVNPVAATREGWRRAAEAARAKIVEIEVLCSDQAEHRRRVETRVVDIAGLRPPTWQDVMARHYEPWDRPRTTIDTARGPVESGVFLLRTVIEQSIFRP